MKNYYLICVLCIASFQNLWSQYVAIPDSNFRKILVAKYPQCFDTGQQMDTTCPSVLNESALDISYRDISSIEGIQYFDSLKNLYCGYNRISAIASLPTKLKTLVCNRNKLINLPSLPNSLSDLVCSANLITQLPKLPDALNRLWCDTNQLIGFPPLPNKLVQFYCYNNQIKQLPTLPNSLNSLICSGNLLTSLPDLPPNLLDLRCHYNQITAIPTLPSKLDNFVVYNNQLTSLPELPQTLRRLSCDNNQISSLPQLPNTLNSLYCAGNPNLYCLPYLGQNIEYLKISPDKISCIPNRPQNLTTTYDGNYQIIPSPKICDVSNNPQHCRAFPTIKGKVFVDANNNGICDNGESPRRGVRVQLNPSIYTLTDENGNYSLTADTIGILTIQIMASKYYEAIPNILTLTFYDYDTTIYKNIALKPKESIEELSVNITANSATRPGFPVTYKVDLQNTGTTSVIPNLGFQYNQGYLQIDSISVFSIQTDSTLNPSLPVLVSGQSYSFLVYSRLKNSARLGDSLQVSAIVSANSYSNKIVYRSVIRGSFDPNDIQVSPTSLTPSQINNSEFVDYTIRFQNTGTDTAFTVIVMDTLPSSLQANTLEMISSSHNCKTTMENGIVSFEFDNISLPDSNTNEIASHGYVRFKVRTKNTLQLGEEIYNSAAIYFDYNSPVLTNSATTIVGNINTAVDDNQKSNKKHLFPNPAKERIYVSLQDQETLTIYNCFGVRVYQESVTDGQEINIESLDRGFYYYHLDDVKEKFVIE